jgi:predicted TPR repeat methyltransferase
MTHVPFDSWVRYLLGCAQDYFGEIPRSVCDLACGTGRMIEHLSDFVKECYGMDGSPAMIAASKGRAARGRIKSGRLQGPLPFREEVFPWIICCHDSLNYLIQPEELDGHFASVALILQKGGLYSADIVTLSNILKHFHGKTRNYRFGQTAMRWSNEYDQQTHIMFSRLNFRTPDGEYFEDHFQKYYSIEEIEASAKRAGLHLFLTEGDYHHKEVAPTDLLTNLHFAKGG